MPRVLVWDGEGAVGQRRRRQTVLTQATQAFRGVLGAKVVICDPGDPEAKGLVERANGYLETSFLPGRIVQPRRRTSTPSWPTGWCWSTSGAGGCWAARRPTGSRPTGRRCCRCRRSRRSPGWRASLRLPRDHYVRLDSNDYSVHPAAVGRRVEVAADLDRVRVWCDGRLVADHGRCWARHQTHQRPRPPGRRGPAAPPAGRARCHQRRPGAQEVQLRRLTDYDAAFGLDDGQGVA